MTQNPTAEAREREQPPHAIKAVENDRIIAALRHTTSSMDDIARTHGRSVGTIKRIAEANGIDWRGTRERKPKWCPPEYVTLNRKMQDLGFKTDERRRIIADDMAVQARRARA